MIDISNVKALKLNVKLILTPAEERSAQSTLLAHLHKMAVIAGERFELDFSSIFIEAPHTTHSRALFGDDSRIPADEYINSADLMDADTKADDEKKSQAQGGNNDDEEDEVLEDANVDAEGDDD
ncbi:hypothetical protein K7X08_016027 [Anisodus acutangulus]|uniref:Uncharacterized protein n=1 Tax=Anisodus acutangulus TaxID=402998 RepID=A0A9Q1R0Y4_9SOLA|nr:hypothetical protein K7X08_016027 [Anisodus acutangulus]